MFPREVRRDVSWNPGKGLRVMKNEPTDNVQFRRGESLALKRGDLSVKVIYIEPLTKTMSKVVNERFFLEAVMNFELTRTDEK
jgi:hypothetical protein